MLNLLWGVTSVYCMVSGLELRYCGNRSDVSKLLLCQTIKPPHITDANTYSHRESHLQPSFKRTESRNTILSLTILPLQWPPNNTSRWHTAMENTLCRLATLAVAAIYWLAAIQQERKELGLPRYGGSVSSLFLQPPDPHAGTPAAYFTSPPKHSPVLTINRVQVPDPDDCLDFIWGQGQDGMRRYTGCRQIKSDNGKTVFTYPLARRIIWAVWSIYRCSFPFLSL